MVKTVTTVTKTNKKKAGRGRISLPNKGKNRVRAVTTVKTVTSKPSKSKKRFSQLYSLTDELAVRSTDTILHSLFVGTQGISRGIAFGSDMTGLTKFRGAFDFTIPASGRANLAICPTALASGNFIYYNVGTTAAQDAQAAPYSPFNSGAGITAVPVAGPFSTTNPSLGWRVVRCSLRLTPTTNALNQGGWAMAAHHPALFGGSPGTASYNGPTTLTDFENIAMQRSFTGLESIHYQFFPNQGEVDVLNTVAYAATNGQTWGGAAVTITGPANSETYHGEYEVGIEYLVNSIFRPYVDRRLPTLHPDALYFMNQFTSKHWIPAVISTVDEWEALVNEMDPVAHEYIGAFHANNKVGKPSDYAKQALFEEQKMGNYAEHNSAYEVISEACNTSEGLFGINPCKLAGKAVGAYAVSRARNYLSGQPHTPMLLG